MLLDNIICKACWPGTGIVERHTFLYFFRIGKILSALVGDYLDSSELSVYMV